MAKIYESFLSTIIPQGKNWVSFDPRSQTLSGEDSTCFPQCLLRTFRTRESKLKRKKILWKDILSHKLMNDEERTGSRSIPEVKPCRARIVLGWLTACKYLVL